MIGDKLQTRHFGEYIERKDVPNSAFEVEGIVKVHTLNDSTDVYLYSNQIKGIHRFDLPRFMYKYRDRKVAVLCRMHTKVVGSKTYYKLVVISAKSLDYSTSNVS